MIISERALIQLNVLQVRYKLQEKTENEAHLRIFVKGAGCQGLKYGIELDRSTPQESDTIVVAGQDALPIVIDAISLHYLKKANLDFEESLQNSKFIVTNPHVSTTCACGTSFGF